MMSPTAISHIDAVQDQRTYAERTGRAADFHVQYQLCPHRDGSPRKLFQGYRCDFMYADVYPGEPANQTWMIWPEFEDAFGNPLRVGESVAQRGTAGMWIFDLKLHAQVHAARLKVGTRAFLVEGLWRTAELEVVEVLFR